MAKKPTPKPLYDLKSDFVQSLDHVLGRVSVFRGAVKTALDVGAIDKSIAEVIREKMKELDDALSLD